MTQAQARRLSLVGTYGELDRADEQPDGSVIAHGHGPGESWRTFTIEPDGHISKVDED